MIGLECLLATVGILERSDVIRAFPKRFTSSCNFARSGKGLIGASTSHCEYAAYYSKLRGVDVALQIE